MSYACKKSVLLFLHEVRKSIIRSDMKKMIAFAALAALICPVASAQGFRRQPTPNDTLRSTVVLDDGKVVFQIYAPAAEQVSVTGDLPWGEYRITETGVPDGYIDSGFTTTVWIK